MKLISLITAIVFLSVVPHVFIDHAGTAHGTNSADHHHAAHSIQSDHVSSESWNLAPHHHQVNHHQHTVNFRQAHNRVTIQHPPLFPVHTMPSTSHWNKKESQDISQWAVQHPHERAFHLRSCIFLI